MNNDEHLIIERRIRNRLYGDMRGREESPIPTRLNPIYQAQFFGIYQLHMI